jgi:hypothetical protein
LTPSTATIIQSVASLLSIAVAISALAVALRSESRTGRRFEADHELASRIAIANIRPILAVFTAEHTNLRGITLANYGVGTAIITSLSFSRDDVVTRNMVELFNFEHPAVWDNYWGFSEDRYYLRAGGQVTLARISESTVTAVHGEEVAREMLDSFRRQSAGIEIRMTYEDVLGTVQDPYYRRIS